MAHSHPSPSQRVHVLVVGLGPVGAALAALLGNYGVPVLAVDREAGILEHPRAIALDHEALRILQNVGLGPQAFQRLPVPFVSMRSDSDGEFARVETDGTIDGHPRLVTFFQPELERALRAQLERRPSVTTLLSTELLRFEASDGGVVAVLRGDDGAEFTVAADYLVAADGANSPIRKQIGLDFEGQSYSEDWLIVDVRGAPEIAHVEFNCNPERPVPRMRAPGGRQRWEFMLQPGESPQAMRAPDSVRRLLSPWVDADAIEIERSAVYRFHARVADRFSKGRVFLVGDAAHLTPPFAGQGLVAGLRDAFNLAWKLAWVCRQEAAPAILDSYDAERRPHAEAMVALARRMGVLIMPRGPVRARLLHGAVKGFRRTRLGRAVFDEQRGKPRNRFSEGLIVEGSRSPSRLRGMQLPQHAVDAAGGATLSDDLLGPYLTLVTTDATSAPLLTTALQGDFEAAGGRIVRLEAARQKDEPPQGLWAPKAAGLPAGQAYIVRPDRVVMHEGPVDHAPRLVREALALLQVGPPAHTRRHPVWNAIRTTGAMYG